MDLSDAIESAACAHDIQWSSVPGSRNPRFRAAPEICDSPSHERQAYPHLQP